jgi:hypothetical protein
MQLSRARRFIFVHVDKTAGTSFTDAFAPYVDPVTGAFWLRLLPLLGSLNRWTGLHRYAEFGNHALAVRMRDCFPAEFWEGCFKFAIVRNPWDRLASRYRYVKANKSHRHSRRVSAMANFAEYACWEMASRRPGVHQHEYLCAGGQVILDFVGRFENLEADFAQIRGRLGLSCVLGHANATDSKDYRSYYDDALADEVGRFYARDVSLFGYTFDGVKR